MADNEEAWLMRGPAVGSLVKVLADFLVSASDACRAYARITVAELKILETQDIAELRRDVTRMELQEKKDKVIQRFNRLENIVKEHHQHQRSRGRQQAPPQQAPAPAPAGPVKAELKNGTNPQHHHRGRKEKKPLTHKMALPPFEQVQQMQSQEQQPGPVETPVEPVEGPASTG